MIVAAISTFSSCLNVGDAVKERNELRYCLEYASETKDIEHMGDSPRIIEKKEVSLK